MSRESTDLRRLWKVYLMGTWGGVAYHLDEQAGRSTVWANGTQIKIQDWSISFRIAFTISTISSIYRKTTAEAWNQERIICSFSLAETGIKDGFEEMEDKFPFAMFRSEK